MKLRFQTFNPGFISHTKTIDGAVKITETGGKVKRFLQRLALRILKRLGAVLPFEMPERSLEFTPFMIDLHDVTRKLTEHIYNIEAVYNRRARLIVVGTRQLAALEGECITPFSFSFPSSFRSNVYMNRGSEPTRIEFQGIEVVCVPWLDGVLVIPETN